jgi:glycosyltransferase involved in cell wall biosynthesis
VNAPVTYRPSEALGKLEGYLDGVRRAYLNGWAMDEADPSRPVGLVIRIDGEIAYRTLASLYRQDLPDRGISEGYNGFHVWLANLSPLVAHEISIQREADGAELPGSPRTLPPAPRFDAEVEAYLVEMLEGLEHGEAESRALAFLARQTDRLLARHGERDAGGADRRALGQHRRRFGKLLARPAGAAASGAPPRPRALFIDDEIPNGRRDAGSVAILSHMRAMAALGHEVGFVAARGLGDQEANEALARREAITAYGAPFYYSVEDVLKRQASGFDVVYLHRLSNARCYLPLARTYQPRARILYSVADLHHLRLARQGAVEARPELTEFSRQIAFNEFDAARRADAVITHSAVEAAVLRRGAPAAKVHVAPWAVFAAPRGAPFHDRAGIAFIGQSAHPPNPDAVQWLTREIMPRVWARNDALRCRIVGYGWTLNAVPDRDDRVDVVGPVPDLGEVLGAVRLTVAPLRFGSGIKGKVLDSFAAGVPCVMSPIAAEGLALASPLNGLVADGAEAIAEAILRLHEDEALNAAAAAAGLEMIAREASEARVIEALAGALGRAPG